MILAIDAHYSYEMAKIVGLLFNSWLDKEPQELIIAEHSDVKPYEPGKFYKRELPGILKLLNKVNLNNIDYIVIDGYVYLDDENNLGLGGYLYEELNGKIPVIGVAKRPYFKNVKNVVEVSRGKSTNPLYVTAIGTDLNNAANKIENMAGDYRIPTLLKQVDKEARNLT